VLRAKHDIYRLQSVSSEHLHGFHIPHQTNPVRRSSPPDTMTLETVSPFSNTYQLYLPLSSKLSLCLRYRLNYQSMFEKLTALACGERASILTTACFCKVKAPPGERLIFNCPIMHPNLLWIQGNRGLQELKSLTKSCRSTKPPGPKREWYPRMVFSVDGTPQRGMPLSSRRRLGTLHGKVFA
jgi:hypothetical protein